MAATAVTPSGVRDGDPDALAGLCDRRGPAVLAYAEVVAGPARAVPAAAAAFGSFRAGVVATADLTTLNPEAMLISATRHAAARFAAADLPVRCTRVPELLAARADRSISLADHDWLEQHLAECWTCRAPVARFDAADRAYHAPPSTRLQPEATAAIVAAMTAAAPTRSEIEAQAMHAAAPSPNGSAAHAPQPPSEQYDVPSLAEREAAGVDQPTSTYVMPAEDLAVPEPPPAARPGRRRGGPGRAAALLGALGLTERDPARAADHGAQAAGGAAEAGGALAYPAQDAGSGAAPGAMSPGARAARRARSTRTRRPAGAEAPIGGGSSLPRPRRTSTAVPAGQRRERATLRPALVLPIVLVVIAIVVALAIAGVFGGGDPASMPQSFAPRTSDEPTSAAAPAVVVVPGSSGADAVEKAKARARAAKRRAESKADTTATPPPAAAAAPKPTPAAVNAAPPPPPPPPPPAAGGGAPKIDADNGATGAEQLPPAEDTSTVPDLAPPVEPAVQPPG